MLSIVIYYVYTPPIPKIVVGEISLQFLKEYMAARPTLSLPIKCVMDMPCYSVVLDIYIPSGSFVSKQQVTSIIIRKEKEFRHIYFFIIRDD